MIRVISFLASACLLALCWPGLAIPQRPEPEIHGIFDGAIGSTRIDKALNLILETARFFNLKNDQIPTMLLIVSDMQFHHGGSSTNETEIEACLKEWDKFGYTRPKIVYWNLSGYEGQQATIGSKDIALVSGFSPSVLKAILSGEDFTPIGIMFKAIEKYEIKVP